MAWCRRLQSQIIIIFLSFQLSGLSYACSQLQVNGADSWFPYFYRGDQSPGIMGNNGIIGDIVFQATHRIGVKAELNKKAPWKRILYDLRNGKIDMVAGALKTEEREKVFSFSNPVYYSEFRVFVRAEKQFQFNKLDDLTGKYGIKIRGMSLGQSVDSYAFEHLVIEDTTNASSLFKMIAAKRVDYGIFYLHSGLSELKKLKLDKTIVTLPKALTKEALYVAFSKESECQPQITQLSQEIDKMKADGSIQKITDYYSTATNKIQTAHSTREIKGYE